jgi:hypothetical protein
VQEVTAQVADALVHFRYLPAQPPVPDRAALLARLLTLQVGHASNFIKAHR